MPKGNYFFALWPDLEVRKQLNSEALQCESQGRLQHPLDLHMTLVYLGQVADGQMRCIEKVADSIVSNRFTFQIDGLGFWHRPRILWAGPTQIHENLSQLVFDLQQGLEGCGFEPERRRYKPHVTLYRKASHAEPRPIEPGIDWQVREFVLGVSGLNRPGEPRYRILKRWPFPPQA